MILVELSGAKEVSSSLPPSPSRQASPGGMLGGQKSTETTLSPLPDPSPRNGDYLSPSGGTLRRIDHLDLGSLVGELVLRWVKGTGQPVGGNLNISSKLILAHNVAVWYSRGDCPDTGVTLHQRIGDSDRRSPVGGDEIDFIV